MWWSDHWLIKVLPVAVLALLAAGALQVYLPSSSNDDPASAEARDGQIVFEQVTNNDTAAVQVYLTPMDGPSAVDVFRMTLEPGESLGPVSLNCTSQWGEGTEARVVVHSLDGGEGMADRRVELEAGDCRPGGGASFDVTVTPDGTLEIDIER